MSKLQEYLKSRKEAFDKDFKGNPPHYCPSCHRWGAAFPNDYVCGNCSYKPIIYHKDFHTQSLNGFAEMVVETIGQKTKPENGALTDGSNEEIEFLFRNGDIGIIATHYRNVGYNKALSDIAEEIKSVIK